MAPSDVFSECERLRFFFNSIFDQHIKEDSDSGIFIQLKVCGPQWCLLKMWKIAFIIHSVKPLYDQHIKEDTSNGQLYIWKYVAPNNLFRMWKACFRFFFRLNSCLLCSSTSKKTQKQHLIQLKVSWDPLIVSSQKVTIPYWDFHANVDRQIQKNFHVLWNKTALVETSHQRRHRKAKNDTVESIVVLKKCLLRMC